MTYDPIDSNADGIIDKEANAHPGRDANQLREIASDGNWTWFHEPRAIHYNGTTYIGWITSDGSIEVGAYDHGTDSLTTNTLRAQFDEDDHSNPTIMIDNSGYIWVFHCGHNEPSIWWFQSSNPEDVTAFDAEQSVSEVADNTYCSPFQFSDGTIRVWSRADYTSSSGSYGFHETTNGGSSWSTTECADGPTYHKPYRDGNNSDVIHFGATTAGHPRNDVTGIGYYKYDHSAGSFQDVDGNAITLPVTDADLDLIWDPAATGERAWIWDCATDSNGHPVLVFATFDPDDYSEHTYRYATYDGTSWNVEKVCDGGSYIVDQDKEEQYSSGIILDDTDPTTCYVSIGDNYSSKIQRWETDDRGQTWTYQDVVGPQKQNVRPVVPWNRHDDFKVAWMRGSYRHFGGQSMDTSINWCDGTATTSVDHPPINVPYNRKVKLMRTDDFGVSGDFNEMDMPFQSKGFEQPFGEWWDPANAPAEIRFPDFGYYQINVWARVQPDNATDWVIDLDPAALDTFDHSQEGQYRYFQLSTEQGGGDFVWLQGSKVICADAYTGDSGYTKIRIRQNSGVVETVKSMGVSIIQLSP